MNLENIKSLEGSAIVYCEGAFGTTTGKTAHGLVRGTRRYRVLSVVDSTKAGRDAGQVLDRREKGIPVHASLSQAFGAAQQTGLNPTHFVVGLAPDGGRLAPRDRAAVKEALTLGLNVDSGLHDFLSDDPELAEIAAAKGLKIRDVRKTPSRDKLHSFTGKIDQVGSLRVAVLGTDSAIGKRTTAKVLVDGLNACGTRAEMIGTGQTAWMQGFQYGIVLDSLINDFVAGELENAVLDAWENERPEVLVVEGQGSLMNPAYPGGLEILAATRPHGIILQHAPSRKEYDGFPGFPLHPLKLQIQALELISGVPVVAITLNHEGLTPEETAVEAERCEKEIGLPVMDVLLQGNDKLLSVVKRLSEKLRSER